MYRPAVFPGLRRAETVRSESDTAPVETGLFGAPAGTRVSPRTVDCQPVPGFAEAPNE